MWNQQMYEYEEFCWWHTSDEDGLDAKLFAANWPEILRTKGACCWIGELYG